MKRQIKFKGQRVDNKDWVYGSLVLDHVHHKSGYSIVSGGCVWYEVIPESVGQFTGIYDSNGLEIYEGDTVLHGQSERFVEWRWSNFVLTTMNITGTILLSFSTNPNPTVTGNINDIKND